MYNEHGRMARSVILALALLLQANTALTEPTKDPCAATSSVSDLQLTLMIKGRDASFQTGEIIPLVLSFKSKTKNRYWVDVRNYDRSGRLGLEYYCAEPETADPLASYFKVGAFMGGGLGTTHALDATPFTAEAELNEWRSLEPGHYHVYAISYRVWRTPDAGEDTPYSRVSETVRSNAIEFEVKPPDPAWQDEQLRSPVHWPVNLHAKTHAAPRAYFGF
jgi:hypothetical protein